MLNKMICNVRSNLIDAWKIINENGKGIAFIIDESEKLCGVLTDGDVRVFLLENQSLKANIQDIMNRNFVFANDKMKSEEILSLFSDKIKIIPIIDQYHNIIDFVEYNKNIHFPIAIPDLKGKEFEYLVDAFLSTWISSTGEYITKFENRFSDYCDTQYGVAVSNGTVAIHLALVARGVGLGDEVIVPDLTFAATINAVLHANATPVIVDVEKESWCIDPNEIKKAISQRTKAIIPVHIYGQPSNMDEIIHLAKEYNLFVVEDCAEAHGAEFNGKKVGSFGNIGCFSFFGNKIITTGEGGMCVTNDKELYEKMKILRDHGMSKTKKYWHEFVGYNYRMTNLQAAIGVAQLERIEDILEDRNKLENQYRDLLHENRRIEFQKTDIHFRKKITWFVSLLVKENRDFYLKTLNDSGIDARPFFYPLSVMPPYKDFLFSNKNSLEISKRGLNLPTNNKVNIETIGKIKNILEIILYDK